MKEIIILREEKLVIIRLGEIIPQEERESLSGFFKDRQFKVLLTYNNIDVTIL